MRRHVALLAAAMFFATGFAGCPGASTQGPPPEPTGEGVIVDLQTRQVYVPDVGWLEEDEFWDLYHNDAAMLPAQIDFDGLKALGHPDMQAPSS